LRFIQILASHWVAEGRKRRGRTREKWTETAKNDLRGLEISWERVEGLAMDRTSGDNVLPNVQTCTGWNKY